MRIIRRIVFILVIVVILIGVLAIAGWGYLRSHSAARQLAARLEAVYGGRVRLDNVDIGTGGSSLHGLRLYESKGDESAEPWLTVEDTDTDVSAWDLLKGLVMPHHLAVSGAKLLLRFDQNGRLLTKLPNTGSRHIEWPTVQVKQSQVTIQQEGRLEMVVHGLSGDLTNQNGRLVLTGAVVDPHWGDWSVNGHIEADEQSGTAALKTQKTMHVTQAMLHDLPLIPTKVWQEVQAEGDTPVELQVRFNLKDSKQERVHYQVALDPEHTTVHVPSIELTAHDAHGRVVIEDEIVHLRKVQGRAADGDIHLNGDLDFAHEPNKLQFAVHVQNLLVKELPKSWELPPQIEGRLTGQANLQIALVDGHPQTSGTGEGVVNDARIAGQPAEPIQLRLHAAGRGYRFAAQQPLPRHPPGAEKVLVASALVPAQPPAAAPPGQDTFLPSRAVNWLMTNTLHGLNLLVQTGQKAMSYFRERPSAAPQPGQPPRYLEANLAMKNINLEQFIKGLGLKLPFPVTGRLTFQVHAAIPIDTARDLKTYRLNGSTSSPQLTIAGLELANVAARVTFTNGVLRLEELRGDVPQGARPGTGTSVVGNFNGTARLQLAPEGDLIAQLTLQNIPLARVMSLLPGEAQQAQGLVSGKFEFLSPAAKLRDVTAWKASGALSTKRVQAFGWDLDNASTEFRLERGILALTKAKGMLEGSAVSATGTLGLTEPFRVRGKLDLQDADLSAVQRLSTGLRPPVTLAGHLNVAANFAGTLRPMAVRTAGTVAAEDLKVEGLTVRNLKLRWTSNADRLSLEDIRANLYGGEMSGAGVIPLRGAAAGSVKLTVKGVDVGRLQQDVPAIPFRLAGTAGGTLEGKLTAAGPNQPRTVNATMDLQAPSLRVQGIPTERLHGTVDYRRGVVDYRLQGESLGGTFDLNGKLPVGREQPARPQPAAPPGGQEGYLRIRDVRLSRLAAALGIEALRPLGGRINLDLSFRNEPGTWAPTGAGRFTLDRFRWGMTQLAPRLQGNVRLDRDEFRLVDLAGELGGGRLRGAAAYNLRQPERSWFSLSLDQGQAARLLAPWPTLAARVAGSLDMHIRGHIGREWRGAGRILFTNGRIAGVNVNDWRIPVDFAFVPSRGRGELAVRDSTAELAMGRATGEGTWTWGGESRLNGQLRFTGLNVQTLIRQLADTGQGGLGQINGRITFAGDNVRSVNDVTADMDATLRQTQAQGLPVIFQVLPFIAPGRSTSALFDSGSLRARLNGGIIRIQRLGLEGRALKIFAEGTVNLEGRLNLEVTGTTGQYGVNPNTLRLLGLRLPVTGPVPVSLILQATSALSNRLIHLRVTGTYRRPSIQIEPLSLLTQEAVYFFLNQAGVPLP